MALSSQTLGLLAKPFKDGHGPSHATITLIWTAAGADEYLPSEEEGNKLGRVLEGLRALTRGRERSRGRPALPPDDEKLNLVVAELATHLIIDGSTDVDQLTSALSRDGFALSGDELVAVRPTDEPTDRIARHVDELFAGRADLAVARNHFEQANRSFDDGRWEAANAQFRSACDATYDALARSAGCPASKRGGNARKWLQSNGTLEADEAELVKAFMAFAGRAGSHAGTSDATDSQLRRHMASALIAFAVAKFD